jgi:hypothetical protein
MPEPASARWVSRASNRVRSSAFWIASSGMPRSARKLRLIPCSAGIFSAYESTPFGSMSVIRLSMRMTACGACAELANVLSTSPDRGGLGSTMWNAWPSSPSWWAMWSTAAAT